MESHSFCQGRNDPSLYLSSLFLLPLWWGSKQKLVRRERKKNPYHLSFSKDRCPPPTGLSVGWEEGLYLWVKPEEFDYYLGLNMSWSLIWDCILWLIDLRTVCSRRNEEKIHVIYPSFYPRSRKIYPNGVYFIHIMGDKLKLCFDSVINYALKKYWLYPLIHSFIQQTSERLLRARHCARSRAYIQWNEKNSPCLQITYGLWQGSVYLFCEEPDGKYF